MIALFWFLVGVVVSTVAHFIYLEKVKHYSELVKSDKKFESVFKYSQIGMAIVAPNGEFMEVNESLCNFLGYTHDELTGMTFMEITYPDDIKKDVSFAQEMINNERKTYYMKKRYITKGGNVVSAILSVSGVFKTDGKSDQLLELFISQVQDLEEVEELKVALNNKNKELEKKNKELYEAIRISNQGMVSNLKEKRFHVDGGNIS